MAKKRTKPTKKSRGGKRPGSGRKPVHPEGKTVLVAARVPETLVEALDEWAGDLSRSEAIVEAIRRLVAK